MMRKWGTSLLAFAVSFSGSLSYGASPPSEAGQELRFRLTPGPTTLDWNLAHTAQETYILMNLMEGLLEEGADLKPKASLAESWTLSEDGRTYTFSLRPDVKWSDGRALQAEDFAASWFRLIDPKLKSTYANLLFDVENAENYFVGKVRDRTQVGIKALSPTQFQVHLKYPVSHFLHLVTIWTTFPIRQDLIHKYGSKWELPGKMAVVGPYVLTEWKRGKSVRLKKNSLYYNPAALIEAPDTVYITIEQDDQRARQDFEKGKLDFLQDISTQDLLDLQKDRQEDSVRIARLPFLATYYLAFNTKKAPLSDPLIRKAIALALDRASIPAVLQGGEIVANSWIPPGISGAGQNPGLTGTLYEAKAALAKAGYPEGTIFPRLEFWIEKFDGADRLARHLARTLLDRLGIPLDIHFGNSDQYRNSKNGALYLTHWNADYPDAYSFLLFFSKNGKNYANWSNATYDRYLEKGIQTSDDGERMIAYSAAERILIQEDVAIHPLFYKKKTVAVSNRLDHFDISAVNYFFFKNVTFRKTKKSTGQ